MLLLFVFIPSQKKATIEEDSLSHKNNSQTSERVVPTFFLDGQGSNIDSLDFWEAHDVSETLLFVSAKANNIVEIWKYPFKENEQLPLTFNHKVNGVSVDQKEDKLYVGLVGPSEVQVFSLPELTFLGRFGEHVLGAAETNLDILHRPNGESWIYVTDNNNVYVYDAKEFALLYTFSPEVSSIETVLSDSFHEIVYVPEEQGASSQRPGVHAFHPNGTPYFKNDSHVFGGGTVFEADEEGILLYVCTDERGRDTGRGFIVIADQKTSATDFEFFDRISWQHLGKVNLAGVKNTDGIASTQQPFVAYPQGIFAAVHADSHTALIGWDNIFENTSLSC